MKGGGYKITYMEVNNMQTNLNDLMKERLMILFNDDELVEKLLSK